MVNTFVLHRQFASGSKQTQPQGSQADLLLVSVWSPGKWQGWGKRCIEGCAEPIAKSICCLLSKLCICHITNVSQVWFNHLLSTFKSAKGRAGSKQAFLQWRRTLTSLRMIWKPPWSFWASQSWHSLNQLTASCSSVVAKSDCGN